MFNVLQLLVVWFQFSLVVDLMAWLSEFWFVNCQVIDFHGFNAFSFSAFTFVSHDIYLLVIWVVSRLLHSDPLVLQGFS